LNPYRVLGVNENATDDEIKSAYRKLVKKYHPDQYADNPLGDLASEKLKEVNQAYDMIRRQRGMGGNGANAGQGRQYGGANSSSIPDFNRARQLIQAGDLNAAESLLDSLDRRPAEWHYLKGVVLLRKGWYSGAQQHFQTACSMEPGNQEYRNAFNTVNNATSGYRSYYGGNTGGGTGTGLCELCACLSCTDCCCECAGGDCIGCC